MESNSQEEQKKSKKTWSKFKRTPKNSRLKGITAIDLQIIGLLNDYRFLPASLLHRLVDAHPRVVQQHLTALWNDKHLVNRFAFLKVRFHGEFIYYLDNAEALKLYADETSSSFDKYAFDTVRYNRESQYYRINDPTVANERSERMRFLQHELGVSRFHAMLEMGCNRSAGKVVLSDWQQGPRVCHKLKIPKVRKEEGKLVESEKLEQVPHEPDAFFSLYFPHKTEEEQFLHFFFEYDRGTMNGTDMRQKFRTYFHYIVKQKLIKEHYGIGRIRAVLVHAPDQDRAEFLRNIAAEPIVSGQTPSPIFWFTHAGLFDKLEQVDDLDNPKAKPLPMYLTRPERILQKVWATPAGIDTLKSIIEAG